MARRSNSTKSKSRKRTSSKGSPFDVLNNQKLLQWVAVPVATYVVVTTPVSKFGDMNSVGQAGYILSTAVFVSKVFKPCVSTLLKLI